MTSYKSLSAAADVKAPDFLRFRLDTMTAETHIFEQRIRINRAAMNQCLSEFGFSQSIDADSLSRRDIFALAEPARKTSEGALNLLWHTLAWGTGRSNRNNRSRIRAVASSTDIPELLGEAAELSISDPIAAYELLRHRRRNRVKYLGPAFFTKFLYFAGGGEETHQPLILDARVAKSLGKAGWKPLYSFNWSSETYGQYLALVSRWQEELETSRGDLIERSLFDEA